MPKYIYGIICLLVAGFVMLTAIRCSKRKEAIAGITARVCLFGALIVLFNAITLFSNIVMVMSVSYSFLFVCMDLMLISLLECTCQLAEYGSLHKVWKWIAGAFTVLDAALLLTNPWTDFALEYEQVVEHGNLYLSYQPNLWYYIHLGYCYFIVLAIFAVLIAKCFQTPLIYAGQYLLELLVLFCVVILNMQFLMSSIRVDVSCILYGLAAIAVYRLAFSYRPMLVRLQIREMLIDKMNEPLVLFDTNERLADFNAEATEKFGLSFKQIRKMTREQFETEILHVSYQNEVTKLSREITLEKDYADIIYKMTIQMLKSKRGKELGQLCMFHDQTKQKMMYNALEKMSTYHSLTGFYTSRMFMQKVEELDKEKINYIVAVCNISGLKLLNSIYGRKIGDKIIMVMSEELRAVLPEDTVISYMEDDYTVMVAKGVTEAQMNLYLSTAARKIKQRAISKIPVFLNYGVACRENAAVSVMEYIRYAEMDLLLKKGKEAVEQKRLMTQALTEEYFRNEYESIQHVKRLEEIAAIMAEKLMLSQKDRECLRLLCCYHDIGRVKTREEVWSRAAVISRDEMDVIKLHPITGYQIVSELELGEDISNLVLCHHENYDGSGYPYGLSGEEIPLVARILNIIDSFDIMVHEQLYKGAVTEEIALEELHRCSGVQFDPELVLLFEECLKERSVK